MPYFSSCFMKHGMFQFQYDYIQHWLEEPDQALQQRKQN
jgi:hypothetical protein